MTIQEQNINELLVFVKSKIGKPVNCQVVMATIESMGVRDKDILSDYGMQSLTELSDYIYEHLCSVCNPVFQDKKQHNTTTAVSGYLRVKTKLFTIYYPLGLMHFIPVLVQVIAIVLFGYSLWTYVGFNQLQSTAVVLGVIIGMICTGGYVQVIGRQASFYWNYKCYGLMNQTINYLVKLGVQSIVAVFALLFTINFFMNIYPYSVLLIVFIYALLIGTLLLILAPMHTIKQRWIVSVVVGVGTITALLLKEMTLCNIYITHWVGIIVAILLSKLFLKYFFYKRTLKNEFQKTSIKLQNIIYHNHQYFFYGVLVYIFIFIDRIFAWSSSLGRQLPYVIYYEKDYEIGMDLAILVFLLLTGAMEYGVASFSKFLDLEQKNISHSNRNVFGKSLLKLYWQHIAILIFSSLSIFLLIYFIITSSWGYEAQFHETLNSLSIKVCVIGSLSYFFLAWAMLNSLYMFTLNRPKKAIKALVISILVNLIVGMIMSRVYAFELSVVGLLMGSLTFLIITLKDCMTFYKKLDYYYYAAY
ncbi:MAG: hypothetical protein ACPGU9_06725 [Flavobacteriaceae bacterium]